MSAERQRPRSRRLLVGVLDEELVDVWQHTTIRDGRLDQLVELFVAPDGEVEMSWHYPLRLQVRRRVAGQFEHFGDEVFEDGGEKDCAVAADLELVDTVPGPLQDSRDGELFRKKDVLGYAGLSVETGQDAHLETGLCGPGCRGATAVGGHFWRAAGLSARFTWNGIG